MQVSGVRIDPLDADGFAPHTVIAASIYGQAMRRSPEVVVQRREILDGHLRNPGFRATLATLPHPPQSTEPTEPVGFGYGYRSAPGQWWHDVVARGLGRERRDWLHDSFELAELHVLPTHQGRGIGARLLADLLERSRTRRVLLSTPDTDTPARQLYYSRGFVDLLSGFFFPGSSEAYAVMGRDSGNSTDRR